MIFGVVAKLISNKGLSLERVLGGRGGGTDSWKSLEFPHPRGDGAGMWMGLQNFWGRGRDGES